MADQEVAEASRSTSTPSPQQETAGLPPQDSAQPRPGPERNGSASGSRSEYHERTAAALERFSSAVVEMRQAADAMRDEGRPPSYRLVHTLGECHREFLRLRLDLTRRIEALGLPVPSLDSLEGLNDLVPLLDSMTEASSVVASQAVPIEAGVIPEPSTPTDEPSSTAPSEVESAAPSYYEPPTRNDVPTAVPASPSPVDIRAAYTEVAAPMIEVPKPPIVEAPSIAAADVPVTEAAHPGEAVRVSALAVIDTILRLNLRDGGEFPPLKECQERTQTLKERVAASPASELPPEAADLASGEHPLAGLLTVVAGVESLSDAQWAAIHARVSEAFGRQLAVAAARGRLVVAPPP